MLLSASSDEGWKCFFRVSEGIFRPGINASLIPVLRRLRKEDIQKFKDNDKQKRICKLGI